MHQQPVHAKGQGGGEGGAGEEGGDSGQADGFDLPPHEEARKGPEKHGQHGGIDGSA